MFGFVLLSAFVMADRSSAYRIKWKKVETVEQARSEMDKVILPGSDYNQDLALLRAQKSSYLSGSGDTVIYFHSKEVSAGFMVAKKWMYTFHFVDRKMTSYTVEKGLTGP